MTIRRHLIDRIPTSSRGIDCPEPCRVDPRRVGPPNAPTSHADPRQGVRLDHRSRDSSRRGSSGTALVVVRFSREGRRNLLDGRATTRGPYRHRRRDTAPARLVMRTEFSMWVSLSGTIQRNAVPADLGRSERGATEADQPRIERATILTSCRSWPAPGRSGIRQQRFRRVADIGGDRRAPSRRWMVG